MMPTPRIDGLDIHPRYQPVTDWAAACAYRLMSVKVSEGRSTLTPGGLDYFRQFRRHGVEFRGVYHWLRADSSMGAQVDNLARAVDQLGGLQPGEFVQLDWERTEGLDRMPSVAEVEEWIALAHQRWPGRVIVYASDWVPGFPEWRTRNPHVPVWYANYNTGDRSTGGWAECARWGAAIWQWTSSAVVPGISNRCDANHVLDWDALARLAGREPVVASHPATPSITSSTITEGIDVLRSYQSAGGPLVLAVDASAIRRVGKDSDGAPLAPITRDGIIDAITEGAVPVGESPFGGRFAGYEDTELHALWVAHQPSELTTELVVGEDTITPLLEAIKAGVDALQSLRPGV